MKDILIAVVLLVVVVTSYAQEDSGKPILLKGVYEDFEQFKANKPIEVDSVFLEKNSGFSHTFLGTGKYKLVSYKNGIKSKVDKSVWGFFDGEYIYKKYDGDFHILMNLGYYCLFDTQVKTKKPGIQYFSSVYFPNYSYTYKLVYVLEYKTGKIYRLNYINMEKSILLDESELLKRFKAETDKEGKVLEYIKLLNEKYPVNHLDEK